MEKWIRKYIGYILISSTLIHCKIVKTPLGWCDYSSTPSDVFHVFICSYVPKERKKAEKQTHQPLFAHAPSGREEADYKHSVM